jgi:hypothetical protein
MTAEKVHSLDVARAEHDQRLIRLEEKAEKFVSLDQFATVKTLVYGLVALILLGFGGALLKVVFK